MTKKNEKLSPRQLIAALLKTIRLALQSNPRSMITLTAIRIVASTLPAVNAVLAGLIVTKLTVSIQTGDATPFLVTLAMFSLVNLVSFSLNTFTDYFSSKISFDIGNHANTILLAKYAKVPLVKRENKEFADGFERAENFANSAEWIFDRVVSLITNFVAFIAAFVAMAVASLPLASIIVIVLIPYFIFQFRQIRRERDKWRENSVNRRKAWRMRWHLTNPQAAIELRLNGLNDYFVEQWRWLFSRDRDSLLNVERKYLPAKIAISTFDTLVGLGVLAWVGEQIIRGVLPIGQFVSFQALMGNLNTSGRGFLWDISYISRDLFNATDYFTLVEAPDPVVGEKKVIHDDHPPKIELRDVTFTYPLADQPALRDVSLVIEPGEDIALVGENGSGKTTLVKIILGLYEPDSGEVLIDGTPLSEINLADYYARVGALFQDFARYDFASLGENIWFGDITKEPRQADFAEALASAKLSDLPKKLKKGYDEILSKDVDEDSGIDLSGGQWQRLALARGFYRSPDILILDEPTAAVDAKAEYEIFQEIASNQELKTTIIISHRFSTVRKAQKIYVIADGEIVEHGTHAELMAINDGLYREMFELQAEGYK